MAVIGASLEAFQKKPFNEESSVESLHDLFLKLLLKTKLSLRMFEGFLMCT